ncbi:cell division protein CDC48 [Toxoplasma gondii ARI]|uniref:Cell division protein CDC48 n=1 Tax=Toxoplasma gondii ARI TaxID=1074872 RepID=A0A139Y584_TOXGO|nr:cell division protein CDC48 [Toxoplasma gondii ARI]
MAFSRHLGAVKRQLEAYVRQRNDEDGRTACSGLSPKDVDTDSFLMFLGRSHPHIVRLRRRLLDKLLETAKTELCKDPSGPASVSSGVFPASGNLPSSVSPYSQENQKAAAKPQKTCGRTDAKRTDGTLAASSAVGTAGGDAMSGDDDSDSQTPRMDNADASFRSSEPISGVEVIHDDDSSESDTIAESRNRTLLQEHPSPGEIHPTRASLAKGAPVPSGIRPGKRERMTILSDKGEKQVEDGEDGERRKAAFPVSRASLSSSTGRERLPLNTSLNSLYRFHALESQKVGGRQEEETVGPQRLGDRRETARRDPCGTDRGKGDYSSGAALTARNPGPSEADTKKRKRRRSPSRRSSFSSPSASHPGDVAPAPPPEDRLRNCAGLSEGLRHQIEESVLLPLLLNSVFERKPGNAAKSHTTEETRESTPTADTKNDVEESLLLAEEELMRGGNDAIGPHPREEEKRSGAQPSFSSSDVYSGLHFSRGVVIHGPAGVGKTKLAFAIAGELSRLRSFSFFPVSLSSLIQNLPPFLSNSPSSNAHDASRSAAAASGAAASSPSFASSSFSPAVQSGPLMPASGEEVLSLMFESAKNHAPSLLLLEDIAVLSSRKGAKGRENREGGGGGNGDEETDSPLIRALAREMDGLTGFDVMVLATCNHIDSLDSSLRRSGRFDAEISIPLPGFNERREILQALTRSLSFSPSVDLNALADRTVGYVAADLHSLVKETVYHAVMRSVGRRRIEKDQDTAGTSGWGRSDGDSQRQPKEEPQMGEATGGTTEKTGEAAEIPVELSHGHPDYSGSSGINPAEAGTGEGKNETGEDVRKLQHGRSVKTDSATSLHDTSPSFWSFPTFDKVWKETFSVQQEDPTSLLPRQNAVSGPASHDAREMLASSPASESSGDSFLLSRAANTVSNLELIGEDFTQALISFTPSYKKTGAFLPRPNVRWNEVGGLSEAKKEVEERILFPLTFADFYGRMGVRKPTGILLYGPPGCGKTFLAKALANACQANFIAVKGPELLSKYVGDSEAALRRLFSRASFFSPSLIFFDEIDALCGSRSTGGKGEGGNKVEERVIAQLLTELDGINDRGKVYVVAATNRPDILDPALLRPGRLEVRVYVHLPDQQERAEILRKGWRRLRREQREERAKRLHLSAEGGKAERELGENDEMEEKDLDFEALARVTDRFSGADLDAVLREATLLMIQEERQAFIRALHLSLNEEQTSGFDPLQLSLSSGSTQSLGQPEESRRATDMAGQKTEERRKGDKGINWSEEDQRGVLRRTDSFYASANAGHLCVKQCHLLEAAGRITPSVTPEQVRFYEDYRESLREK